MRVSILQLLLICMPMSSTMAMLRGKQNALPFKKPKIDHDGPWDVPPPRFDGANGGDVDEPSCNIQLEVICLSENDESCDDLLPEVIDICEEAPSSITMHYKGGDCSQSNYALCTDHGIGVLAPEDTPYVVATSSDGTKYFEGFVGTDDAFVLRHANDQPITSDITIDVYESDVIHNDNLLQTVTLPTSCSNVFFGFAETLGSMQLIEFTNDSRGGMDSPVTFDSVFRVRVDLYYYIRNLDTIEDITLEGLRTLTDISTDAELMNLDIQVNDYILAPSKTIIISEGVPLDLTVRDYYTVITNVSAFSGSTRCNVVYTFGFTAGVNLD
mmetsp:Transcript_18584/g.26233  ORF Transcript_18584/g.26233 Transcript_18584/m.26233 type:complete len:327 (-) Transcript_18584:26-1006(-)